MSPLAGVASRPAMRRWFAEDTRRRRLLIALSIYVLTTGVYFACAAPSTLRAHTQFNHFALLAEAWLNGRLDLGGPPPPYAQNNDFAEFKGKWFVTFPPFPALLMLPLVKLAGSAVRVQDGQFFLWLSGIAPAVLFLALEKLRRTGRGSTTPLNVSLTLLFAFGSVYYFCAEQGTVWFAAHVVGAALVGLYLLFALEAESPLLAGLMIGLGFMTRAPVLFAVPLFLFEALRVCSRSSAAEPRVSAEPRQLELPLAEDRQLELPLAAESTAEKAPPASAPAARSSARVREFWASLDKRRLFLLCAIFAAPIVLVLGISMLHNRARFGDPFEVGYRYLTVAWRPRMEKWGLFHYHYLPRNLGVVLTSLPWPIPPPQKPPFQINLHGLALWFTTPAYLWLLWPRRTQPPHLALWLTVAAVAVPTLFYQNTGWMQFGYRFSNDYSPFLFALLAIGGYRLKSLFFTLGAAAVAINAFGALTFGRPEYNGYYYNDPSQRQFYQPD